MKLRINYGDTVLISQQKLFEIIYCVQSLFDQIFMQTGQGDKKQYDMEEQSHHKQQLIQETKRTVKQNNSVSRTSLLQIQAEISELKQQLSDLTKLPETIKGLSEQVGKQILNLTDYYERIIYELKVRCEDLRAVFVGYEEAKQLERKRLIMELEGKDETIRDLLKRIGMLERKHTERAKEESNYPDLVHEIRSLHENNSQLVGIIAKYQCHIERMESKERSLEKNKGLEGEGRISPNNKLKMGQRNDFLRDRYFEFKRENELLRSRISSLTKSEVKEVKQFVGLKGNYTFAGTLKNSEFKINTTAASPPKHLYHSTVNSKSNSKEKPKEKNTVNRFSKTMRTPVNKPDNLNLSKNSNTESKKKTPNDKVRELLERNEATKRKHEKNHNSIFNSSDEIIQNNPQKDQKAIYDFLSTLRSNRLE